MKLANCVVGTKVIVKDDQNTDKLIFWGNSKGQTLTITHTPDSDGDVRVTTEGGRTDIGHRTNLRKYKGAQA